MSETLDDLLADDLVSRVAAWGHVLRAELFIRQRSDRIAQLRGVAIYLIRRECRTLRLTGSYRDGHDAEYKPLSYPWIAAYFHMNHTTIMYWCRQIEARCAAQPGFAAELDRLAARQGGSGDPCPANEKTGVPIRGRLFTRAQRAGFQSCGSV